MSTGRSLVWQHFAKMKDGKSVQCRICQKRINYNSNTSNMISHLKIHHVTQYNHVKAGKEEVAVDISSSDDDEEPRSSQTSLMEHSFNSTQVKPSTSSTKENSEVTSLEKP